MSRRDLLERALAGLPTQRIPIVFNRTWPGDDQRAADLARVTVDFQRAYGWDWVQLTPASTYSVVDYGLQDAWQGDITGDRTILKPPVKRSLDWTEIRPLDVSRGEIGKMLEAVRMVADELRAEDVPVLATVYSPLAQAERLSGQGLFVRNMRTHLDRLRTGLNALTETTLRLIEALRHSPIAGIVYVIEHASFSLMSDAEYAAVGLPYDRKILDSLPEKWWLNVLHLRGTAPMFDLGSTYPVQVIRWNDSEDRPDLAKAKAVFRGGVCGGLSRTQHLLYGTPNIVREAARDAIHRVDRQRLILSSDDALLPATPLSNLRAAREIADSMEGA